jgi:hypothetical protein
MPALFYTKVGVGIQVQYIQPGAVHFAVLAPSFGGAFDDGVGIVVPAAHDEGYFARGRHVLDDLFHFFVDHTGYGVAVGL